MAPILDDATADPWPALSVPTLVDHVFDELSRGIFDGSIAPGSDVAVSAVVSQMNVSRAPAREACNLLVAAGPLLKRKNASYRVREWTEHDLHEMNLIR